MRKLSLPTTTALALALVSVADAAPMTATVSVSASAFTDQGPVLFGDPSRAPPLDPAALSVDLTLDPALDAFGQTRGVTLITSTVPISAPVAYSYDHTNDVLTLSDTSLSGVGITEGSNDVLVTINGFQSAPMLESFLYTSATTPGIFLSSTGTVQVTPQPSPVPEPTSLALLAGAVALFTGRRRS
jgi:hypothetical protein